MNRTPPEGVRDEPPRSVTLADVAREAGVSSATASRALSARHPDVRPTTREHVRQVAERLGFRPNPAARALRTGRSRSLVVAMLGETFGWWDMGLRGAAAAALNLGYHVFAYPLEPAEPLGELFDSLKDLRADGVLLVSPGPIGSYRAQIEGLEVPLVLIEDERDYDWATTVCAQNEDGGYQATRHLLELGHRRIAAIAPAGKKLYVDERLSGYRSALEEYGVPWNEELVIESHESYSEPLSSSDAIQFLLANKIKFDALFCLVDYLAASALTTLRREGLHVPGDVSVVGFDDERAARLVDPPLTTIRQPITEMGELATRLLVEGGNEERPREPRRHQLPVKLIVRASTAARTSSVANKVHTT
jgi:DNA-binding LacI/PurR family transcriptional regulator